MQIEKHVPQCWPGDHRLHKCPWWERRVNKISFMRRAQIAEWMEIPPILRLPLRGRRSEREAASPNLGPCACLCAWELWNCALLPNCKCLLMIWPTFSPGSPAATFHAIWRLASFPSPDWSLCSCLSSTTSPAQESHLHALCALPSVLVHLCTCLLSVQPLCSSLSRWDVPLPVADPSPLWRSFCFDQRVQIPRHCSPISIDNVSVRCWFRSSFVWEKCLYHEWFDARVNISFSTSLFSEYSTWIYTRHNDRRVGQYTLFARIHMQKVLWLNITLRIRGKTQYLSGIASHTHHLSWINSRRSRHIVQITALRVPGICTDVARLFEPDSWCSLDTDRLHDVL